MDDLKKRLELAEESELQTGYHGQSLELWLHRKRQQRIATEKFRREMDRLAELHTPTPHDYLADRMRMEMVCAKCGHTVSARELHAGHRETSCLSGIELDE